SSASSLFGQSSLAVCGSGTARAFTTSRSSAADSCSECWPCISRCTCTGGGNAAEGARDFLSGAVSEGVEQIPHWEHREAKDRTGEIKVVSDAMVVAPLHRRKQVESFANMRENNREKTC